MPDEKHTDFWASFFLSIGKIWILVALPIMTAIVMIGQNMASNNPIGKKKLAGVVLASCFLAWILTYLISRAGYPTAAMYASPIITYTGHGLSLMIVRKLPTIVKRVKKVTFWGATVEFKDDETPKP